MHLTRIIRWRSVCGGETRVSFWEAGENVGQGNDVATVRASTHFPFRCRMQPPRSIPLRRHAVPLRRRHRRRVASLRPDTRPPPPTHELWSRLRDELAKTRENLCENPETHFRTFLCCRQWKRREHRLPRPPPDPGQRRRKSGRRWTSAASATADVRPAARVPSCRWVCKSYRIIWPQS